MEAETDDVRDIRVIPGRRMKAALDILEARGPRERARREQLRDRNGWQEGKVRAGKEGPPGWNRWPGNEHWARAGNEAGGGLICAGSRARWRGPGEAMVRRMVWDIADCYPFYGYRRVAAELRRRGVLAGPRKVRRIMKEEGLRALRPGRGDWAGAAAPNRDDEGGDGGEGGEGCAGTGGAAPIVPDLLAGMELDGPDQAWAVDVTCIRLEREFVFLAAVLDLFSRRCIGWSLGRHFHRGHVLRALRKAFRMRAGKDLSGLVVHSDRGLAPGECDYRRLLEGRGIRVSAGRGGWPGDNARIERFFGTLKYEDLRIWEHGCFEEAQENIRDLIDEVYNRRRLHSSLGYVPPQEFEEALEGGPPEGAKEAG